MFVNLVIFVKMMTTTISDKLVIKVMKINDSHFNTAYDFIKILIILYKLHRTVLSNCVICNTNKIYKVKIIFNLTSLKLAG